MELRLHCQQVTFYMRFLRGLHNCYLCIHIYIYTYIYIYTNVCIHIHIYTYMHTNTVLERVCICVQHFFNVCIHTHTRNIVQRWYRPKNVHIFACKHVFCIYTCTHLQGYIHDFPRIFAIFCDAKVSVIIPWWLCKGLCLDYQQVTFILTYECNIFWCVHVSVCSYAYCMI